MLRVDSLEKTLMLGGIGGRRIDAFVSAKWKRMRIFVKMQHVNYDLFGKRTYFSALHYPLNARVLKLGFSWGFYD